jgi:hypothetical protein
MVLCLVFVVDRNTGDTVELARMQVFAIEAQEQKIDIHPEANPTAVRPSLCTVNCHACASWDPWDSSMSTVSEWP